MKKVLFTFYFVFLFTSFNSAIADSDNDQWIDKKQTYYELIQDGYEVKAYDITNFKDSMGNMYMFFVTVLQKSKTVIECQEYQVFDQDMNTISLTFVCRELVKPYRRGIGT
tara:strand:- start:4 stop:336 length:333 start_codon:yes stop_codon:yes gene_type:complete